MDQESNDESQPDAVQDMFHPDQNRSLSGAILEVIGEFKDEDVTKSDFVLYDDINPDALDDLFRHDSEPRTTVGFTTDGVRVELYGNDGVEITVRDRPD